MTDEKMQPEPSDRLDEQARPEQSGNDAQQQAGVPDVPAHRGQPSAPGRKPLFRS